MVKVVQSILALFRQRHDRGAKLNRKLAVGPLFLNIGCADVDMPGHINIDARETAATDLVANAWDLKRFSDASVTKIYSRHMIEHLEPGEALEAAAEWYRILQVGGQANVICPDLAFHARQFLGEAQSSLADQAAHAMAGFYGWKEPWRGGAVHDAHRWGYVFDTLSAVFRQAGFQRVDRVTSGPDSEPWHLNVVAFK